MVKVSIIIPVYNNKTDILNAIHSVIKQTYKDWEIIIIDDCSTDGTYQVIKKFIRKNNYKNIFLIKNNKNQGVYISLNEGLLRANGEYICRLDSDDIIIPQYLEICTNILNKFPEYAAVNSLFKRGNKKPKHGCICLFYRKTVIDKMGYYDSVRFAADSEFKERIYKVFRGKILNINKITYYAKIRENSLTTSAKSNSIKIRSQYVKKYRKWHKSNNILYMPYPLKDRPYPIKPEMMP